MTDHRSSAARRARGLHRLEVWLPAEIVRKLDDLAEDSGYSRAELLETMIELEWQEMQAARSEETPGDGSTLPR